MREPILPPLASIVTTINMPHTADISQRAYFLSEVVFAFSRTLVRSSASHVYLLTGDVQDIKGLCTTLPSVLGSRMHVLDYHSGLTRTLSFFLKPVEDEADFRWNQDHNSEQIGSRSDQHEHTVCIIHEFLELLVLAQTNNAEADVDLSLIKRCIARLNSRLKSREACAVLAPIEGIVNTFSIAENVPTLDMKIAIPSDQTTDLLEELMRDSVWTELSAARYRLGFVEKAKAAVQELLIQAKKLLRDPKKKKWITMGRQIVNQTATSLSIPVSLPEIENIVSPKYCPILHSIDRIKPQCMVLIPHHYSE